MPETANYTFQRFGRAYHLRVDEPGDLRFVLSLDEALWVANSASTDTINADAVLLDYLDPNDDKRVHAHDVKESIRWMLDRLATLDGVVEGNETLRLDAIAENDDEGRRIRLAADKILKRVGAPDSDVVTLEHVRKVKKAEDDRGLSAAGIVLPAAAQDEVMGGFLEAILATVGGAAHPAGGSGVTEEHLKQFLDEARTHLAWAKRAELAEEGVPTAVMPLGADTHAAYELLASLRDKIDQFFSLCHAARIDPQVADRVWAPNAAPKELDLADSSALEGFLVATPLARPNPNGRLDVTGELNPQFAADVARFHATIMTPLGAGERLDRDEWSAIVGKFSAHRAWFEDRPEVSVGSLEVEALQAFVDDERFHTDTLSLIVQSHRTALDLREVHLVEQLILYQAWMLPFVNSFVSFPALYDPKKRALFEMGTLIMDGRHFTLAVRVLDRELHKRLSAASNVFVLFVEITDREGQPRYEVAIPVTSGGRGNLQVGKRGIFVDTEGISHHAKVIHIVENPISFREALISPFVRMGQAITGKLEKMQSVAEDRIEKFGVGAVSKVETTGAPAEAAPQPAPQSTGGVLAGGGIALAALGSSGAFVISTLADTSPWTIVAALGALSQVILLPILLVAWIKLRRRDLSSILEGSGWGINARMRLDRRQAETFTLRPPFPPGARGIRHRAWWVWLVAALVVVGGAVAIASWQGLI